MSDLAPVLSDSQRSQNVSLDDPGLLLNRELSFLAFNRRVFDLAKDPSVPLLERLRYLTICSTNLDEFFEVRVAGLKQQRKLKLERQGSDGLGTREQLKLISQRAHRLVEEQYDFLNGVLLPALENEGIKILGRSTWGASYQSWLRDYFIDQISPVLTPVGLDPAHPFPQISNKALSFIIELNGSDAYRRESSSAVLYAPRSLPRLIALPAADEQDRAQCFVLLSSIIKAFVGEMFPGMTIQGCYEFRITRNSHLWVDEDEADDLLDALAGELPRRDYGSAVRLEADKRCPEHLIDLLLQTFELKDDDVYRVAGPVNLHRLSAVLDEVDRPRLLFPSFVPAAVPSLSADADVFAAIRQHDIFLHHPFDSFAPVVNLLEQAARDPQVLAIKMTLYRTGVDSPIVDALLEASRNGKEVAVVVELRARFDEAANIELANRLQEAGATVAYGVVGYKTHAKMLLVVRREAKTLKRYVHLSTGNYHARTATLYTDAGLLSTDESLGRDVHRMFLQLTGLGQVSSLTRILQSPFSLKAALLKLIADEIEAAQRGEKAEIILKMNSLSEPEMIRALYRASQAGVSIELIIRGICCLRPGLDGVSENIRVRSILGRFLEHTRVFYFYAGGLENLFISSADWMERNLLRRVETCIPITHVPLKARLKAQCLDLYLQDDSHAWHLDAQGEYERSQFGDKHAQQRLIEERLI